jgi:DeoR C terminal sensor domain
MMRTGSVPARRRFELIRLAQRKVSSPWQNFPRSLESPQTRFDGISIYSQWAVLSGGLMEERSRRIILSRAGFRPPNGTVRELQRRRASRKCVSELIEDGESVILNGGSTTRLFAFELGGKKDLTVVTNSLGIAAALSRQTVRDIVVLGGEYRAESHITVGSVAFCGAIAVSADSAVLGVGGITQDGIFAELLQDATMTAA